MAQSKFRELSHFANGDFPRIVMLLPLPLRLTRTQKNRQIVADPTPLGACNFAGCPFGSWSSAEWCHPNLLHPPPLTLWISVSVRPKKVRFGCVWQHTGICSDMAGFTYSSLFDIAQGENTCQKRESWHVLTNNCSVSPKISLGFTASKNP